MTGVTAEVTAGTMESDQKGGWRTGQTEWRGTVEGEAVGMKHLIKVRNDVVHFYNHVY